ncbi:MAG TPA: hypothetical protein VFC79_10010, partial [Tissierellaceae bacterium]|nr:hypothetical protein [Tissierellaceae bacterium]
VGNFGGRSGVMNNDNIVEAVSKGVSQAVREVMGGDNQQPISLVVNVGEDTLVDKLINGVNRESRIQGRTVIRV